MAAATVKRSKGDRSSRNNFRTVVWNQSRLYSGVSLWSIFETEAAIQLITRSLSSPPVGRRIESSKKMGGRILISFVGRRTEVVNASAGSAVDRTIVGNRTGVIEGRFFTS